MEGILSFFVLWSASCAVFGFVAGRCCAGRCCRARVRAEEKDEAFSDPPRAVLRQQSGRHRAEEQDEAVSDPPRAVLRNRSGRHVESVFHTCADRTMVHASANCSKLKAAKKQLMRREVCSECFPDKLRQ